MGRVRDRRAGGVTGSRSSGPTDHSWRLVLGGPSGGTPRIFRSDWERPVCSPGLRELSSAALTEGRAIGALCRGGATAHRR